MEHFHEEFVGGEGQLLGSRTIKRIETAIEDCESPYCKRQVERRHQREQELAELIWDWIAEQDRDNFYCSNVDGWCTIELYEVKLAPLAKRILDKLEG